MLESKMMEIEHDIAALHAHEKMSRNAVADGEVRWRRSREGGQALHACITHGESMKWVEWREGDCELSAAIDFAAV